MHLKQQLSRHRQALQAVALGCCLTAVNLLPAASNAESLQDVIREARKEGQLNVTWGASTLGGTKGLSALQEMINKKYNVKVNIKATPGPSMSRTPLALSRASTA